ncbi:ionotropic receptor 21a-like [Centruroides vittatus]|uniref:ionotropic receptor 21a-like n=1 Tax=Centruroides vittatus TaxID=120091 RepID=UPI0035101438
MHSLHSESKNIKKWQVRKTEEKESVSTRKKNIIDRFRTETCLFLGTPKQGGETNTNDGNSAKRFFSNATLTAEITGVNKNLKKRFSVILQALATGYEIDTSKFEIYTKETAELYVTLYHWYTMPVSLHKVQIHGSKIISSFLVLIGQLSVAVPEARHKEFKKFNPLVTNLRSLGMKKKLCLTANVLKLLKAPSVTVVQDESESKSEYSSFSTIWNLTGIQIPFLMKLDDKQEQVIWCIEYDTFQIVQNRLNFKYKIVKPIPKVFQGQNKNGSLIGLVGQLATNVCAQEADMSVIPVFITAERYRNIHFSSYLNFESIKFVVKAPEKEVNWNSIIKPFTYEVWILIICVIIICGIALNQILKYDYYRDGISEQTLRKRIHCLTSNKIKFLTLDLLETGGELNSVNRLPSRILIATWLLSLVVLIPSYSGTLMSFLTAPTTEPIPRNIQELVQMVTDGTYSCGVLKGSGLTRYILNSQFGETKFLSDYIKKNKNIMSSEEGFERTRRSKFSFITTEYHIRKTMKSYKEEKFKISEDSFTTFIKAYGLRKNFEYKNKLDEIISHIFDAGLTTRQASSVKEKEEIPEIHALTTHEMFGPFVLLITGYILSIAIFILEHICNKILQK